MRLAILPFVAAAWFASAPAAAHAFLDHALPAVGSTVHASPPAVRLWFTEPLEPVFSTVRVVDSNDKPVDAGDSHVDSSDSTVLSTTVSALAPGTYRVIWRVVSVDTHVTEGHYSFDVVR